PRSTPFPYTTLFRSRLDPAFAPAAIRGRDRFPAAVPADGGRGRSRPGPSAGHGMGHSARSRPGPALPRPGRGARRRAVGPGEGRQDIADPRPLGRTDPALAGVANATDAKATRRTQRTLDG